MHTLPALVLGLALAEVFALAQHDDLRRLVLAVIFIEHALAVIFIEHALAVVRAHGHRRTPRYRLPALDVLELVRGVVLAVVRVPRDLRAHAREERRRGALRVAQARGQLRVRRVPAPRRHRGREGGIPGAPPSALPPPPAFSTSCTAPRLGWQSRSRRARSTCARRARRSSRHSRTHPGSCGTREAD
jgi:hypothetical protein